VQSAKSFHSSTPPLPPQRVQEDARIAALRAYGILDTPPERAFDDLAKIAAEACGTRGAFISFVDEERIWFKARVGLFDVEAPRATSFCTHTIVEDDLLVVPDARADARFVDNPLVRRAPRIRFYAGVPLIAPGGFRIGTISVFDSKPQPLSKSSENILSILARGVVTQLEFRSRLAQAANAQEHEQFLRAILEQLPVGICVMNKSGEFVFSNKVNRRLLGSKRPFARLQELTEGGQTFVEGTADVYPPERLPIVRALNGETSAVDDIEIRTTRGERHIVEVDAAPLVKSDGTISHGIAVVADVSARKELELQLMRKVLHLDLLRSVAMKSTAAATIEDALFIAVSEICGLTGWPAGHFWMVSNDGTLFPSRKWFRCQPAQFQSLVRMTRNLVLAESEGLQGRVAASREPLWIDDVQAHREEIRGSAAVPPGVRTIIALPVIAGPSVVAVLEFFSDHVTRADSELLAVLSEVCKQIGYIAEKKRAEAAVMESEERYRDFVENSLDLFCTHTLDGQIIAANKASAKALGYEEASDIIGRNLREFLVGSYLEHFPRYIEEVVSKGTGEGLMRVRTREGSSRYWEFRNTLKSTPGALVVRGVARDVTEKINAERRLRQSEEQYRMLFERNLAGVCRTTIEGTILEVNDAFVRMLGYDSKEEVRSLSMAMLHHDDTARRLCLESLLSNGTVSDLEAMLRRKDGTAFWALVNATLVVENSTGQKVIESTILDITSRKVREEKAAHDATHDAVTGLPNRVLFMERLNQSLKEVERNGSSLAVAFVDLDGFKPVNDLYGHAAGDETLRVVAARFRAALRAADTVARVGGDEFAVLMLGTGSAEEAAAVAEKLIATLQTPVNAGAAQVSVGASAGVATIPPRGMSAAQLICGADTAMYRAKANGKGRVEVWSQ